jgi:hypothetical protein
MPYGQQFIFFRRYLVAILYTEPMHRQVEVNVIAKRLTIFSLPLSAEKKVCVSLCGSVAKKSKQSADVCAHMRLIKNYRRSDGGKGNRRGRLYCGPVAAGR